MPIEEIYMRRCLELAAQGMEKVSPNPMVGAIIVHKGEIVGEGFHEYFGGPHAEVNAVESVLQAHHDAARKLANSTLYVSLEPCSFHGKTPACTGLIIAHRIPRVVIACLDPNQKVNGNGLKILQGAGVEVHTGLLEAQAQHLNRRFFTRIQKHRPYILLKWAETADGYFAPLGNKQRWITGNIARTLTHRWRSEEDAVLVGKNTALADNPALTSREHPGKHPVRVVLDKNLELPEDLTLFDRKQKTVVLNLEKTELLNNLTYIALESFDYYLAETIAYQLYMLDIQSVIIEGGAKTLSLFIAAGLWDEARILRSSHTWGEGIPAPILHKAPQSVQAIGSDTLSIIFR